MNLNSLVNLDFINIYVDDNRYVTSKDVTDIIEYLQTQILQRIQTNKLASVVTAADFTTNVPDIIVPGNFSVTNTIEILVTVTNDSQYLFGSKNVQIIFNSGQRLDLSTLNNKIEYQGSKLITKNEAKQK
ncbi:hypothetical protein [Spiroplasma endosymbiont of Labia minor]|uniref:hypothetical protein n=1 Tax=Spiroplasma endosymbiont of Labia minor TaxID=3066305 RepID=UPI0030CE1DE6